ncbi:MAG: DUF4366 domain-containing protein [Clostridia bacterium]|nr:DUF4366 domain-containing protein [Clostridia bacterium]
MKPNKHKFRLLACLCAVIVSVAAFSVSASATAYYASDESGSKVPPGSIDSITISTEDVELDHSGSNATTEIGGITVDLDSFFENLFSIFGGTDALTPVGNLTLIDDILQDESTISVEKLENEQKSKQFITVQSKNGNYFYIIIDRSGDTENVYFLNLVDETDLFALLETEEETNETEPETKPVPTCICEDKCITGEVNTKCEICVVTMKDCGGKEVVQAPPVTDPEPEKQDNSKLLLLLLLLAAGGGGAYWYFKMYKPKQDTKGNTELDDSYFEDTEDDPVEYEESEETEDKT